MNRSKRVKVLVGRDVDVMHTAHVLAGLFSVASVSIERGESVQSAWLHLEVDGRKIVIDLADQHDWLDEAGLAWCDLYLKRCVREPRGKIVPFGLNFAARGTYSALRTALVCADSRSAVRLLRLPTWNSYEAPPSAPVDDCVLLQTRLWDAEDCPNDECINLERVELVAALKSSLGDRFRGGLIDTPLARTMAPKLIATGPTRRSEYIRWQKSAKVGVYTRGLFDSIGFKLAEYLASSKCIVSEPLGNRLPHPLVDGTHLRTYRDPKECVEICKQMLDAPAHGYRLAAWQYYQEHVRLCADALRSCGVIPPWS